MADIDKLVARTRQAFKLRPTLPLGQDVELGAVGVIEDDRFQYRGTVATLLGVAPGRLEAAATVEGAKVVSSGRDVRVKFLPRGTRSETFPRVVPNRVRAEVTFAKAEGFLLAAHDVTVRTLAEPNVLFLAILGGLVDGTWLDNYVFVHQVGIPRSVTAILPRRADTTVLLRAMQAPEEEPSSLDDLAHGYRLVAQTPRTEALVGARRWPAFYNAYRLRDGWLDPAAAERALAEPTARRPSGQLFERV